MCKDAQRSLVAHVDIRVIHIILRAITDFASPVHKSHSSISISDLPRMFIQTTLFRKYLNYSEARLQKMLSCPRSLFPIFLAPLCGQCCRCRCRAVVLMLLPRHANWEYAHLSTSKSVQCILAIWALRIEDLAMAPCDLMCTRRTSGKISALDDTCSDESCDYAGRHSCHVIQTNMSDLKQFFRDQSNIDNYQGKY